MKGAAAKSVEKQLFTKIPSSMANATPKYWVNRVWSLCCLGLLLLIFFSGLALALDGDPNGQKTYQDDIQGLKISINYTWTLICAFLVFFMQAGFAFLGAGLIRAKNTLNYLTKSYMDFSAAALSFWAFGFALMFGGSKLAPGLEAGNGWFGYSGFFLAGDSYDVSTAMFWLFQMVFAATAATIVAGAVAERLKFQAYLLYSFFVTAIIYPVYGHWVWGGGWLATLPYGAGAKDFAGSGVVHAVGGLVALAGAWLVGPRTGKYNSDGTPNAIPGHNLVYVIIGTFILFFGWFGFNPGSTLAATDLRISVIAVNTFLAGAVGAVVIIYLSYFMTGKADTVLACNGALAGLVGITAPCAYVAPWAAIVIGAMAALIMRISLWFVEYVLKVDDPVGAVSVHGAGGLWGLLSLGIFADGTYQGVRGLIMGETGQLIAQAISCLAVFAWALGMGLLTFFILKHTVGIRVPIEEELQGLDLIEHGMEAYS